MKVPLFFHHTSVPTQASPEYCNSFQPSQNMVIVNGKTKQKTEFFPTKFQNRKSKKLSFTPKFIKTYNKRSSLQYLCLSTLKELSPLKIVHSKNLYFEVEPSLG